MFAVKIVLSVPADESTQIRHSTQANSPTKIILPSTTDDETAKKRGILKISLINSRPTFCVRFENNKGA
jgi:hypothetical protein